MSMFDEPHVYRTGMRALALLCAVAACPPLPGDLAWQVVAEVACGEVPGGPVHWRWPHAFAEDWSECPRLTGSHSHAWRVAVDWYLEHVGAV